MLKLAETTIETAVPATRLSVPFMDLKAQFRSVRDEVLPAMEEVASEAAFILGPRVAEFEDAFAAYVGAGHCVAVNSGTSALHLALLAAGVGPGDEVITVSMTFVATSWAISYCGARPVFVDVNPVTYTMDPDQVEAKITRRTKAILPVHLYGQPADLGSLLEIGLRYGIPVIEDACQAHGATYRGRPVGSIGQSGCFSFYPGKNLGAFGEGGAVVTNDPALATRMRTLRDHAQPTRYVHTELGFNYRMDGLQGAVLRIKLNYLPDWTATRCDLAVRYRDRLADSPAGLPAVGPNRTHVWHLFIVRHPDRDRLRAALADRNVQTGLHYPTPVHLQPAYAHLGHKPGDFPVTERIARECLSLPLFPEMTDEQHDAVVAALKEII
ncbi:MAG TPA: DegT/DnrJ/EryC1/StrS family aminotransferase [Gemmataceae bacterium]|nr:DegT/DnrJ/EryC1/StrS family aminotransferase [Gemmataceae bacterium]